MEIVLQTGFRQSSDSSKVQCGEVQSLGLSERLQLGMMNVPSRAIESTPGSLLTKILLMGQLYRLHQQDIMVGSIRAAIACVLKWSGLHLYERIEGIGFRHAFCSKTDSLRLSKRYQIRIVRNRQRA